MACKQWAPAGVSSSDPITYTAKLLQNYAMAEAKCLVTCNTQCAGNPTCITQCQAECDGGQLAKCGACITASVTDAQLIACAEGTGGLEPWEIALAVLIPLLFLGAVFGGIFGSRAVKKKRAERKKHAAREKGKARKSK